MFNLEKSAINPSPNPGLLLNRKTDVNTLNICVLQNTLQYCATIRTPIYSSKNMNFEWEAKYNTI
jgi:hypothetical protein